MRRTAVRAAAGTALTLVGLAAGAGVASASQHAGLVHTMSPGQYTNWGPNVAASGGVNLAQGKGQFGERNDATAVGGTQNSYDIRPGGDGAFVSVTYYWYGPETTDASNHWYPSGTDRTSDWYQASWHPEYESATLIPSADRSRGYLKACSDRSLALDPCSSTSIITLSY